MDTPGSLQTKINAVEAMDSSWAMGAEVWTDRSWEDLHTLRYTTGGALRAADRWGKRLRPWMSIHGDDDARGMAFTATGGITATG